METFGSGTIDGLPIKERIKYQEAKNRYFKDLLTNMLTKQYKQEGYIMHDPNGTETNTKSHYVNLAGVTLPGYYIAKTETREGTKRTVVRVDLTMYGDESQTLRMFHGDNTEVSALMSDTSTYFGPLPLE